MKYYLMRQDKKSIETPQIYNWSKEVNEQLMKPECYKEIKDITLLKGKFASNTTFKEIILMPFILLPKEAADLLQLYEPYMEFKEMPVMDVNLHKVHQYIFPLLKEYDCLSEKSEFNRDKSLIVNPVMKKDCQPDCALFMPKGVNGRNIIVREDYCEALLKRYIFGYTLTNIEIEG